MYAQKSPSGDKVLWALQDFLHLEAAGGLILMMAAVLALIVANSPLAIHYNALLDLPFEIKIGTFEIAKPLLLWINDGLMAVFFFLVGMELKREVVEGHLSTLRQASLPAFAALGGMLAPAAIYVMFNRGDPVAMAGWAIPTATDIAFALGVLSLLGKRVPTALKAFLLSVAIFDDLGAIIVIALFYTAKLSMLSLVVAAVLILGLASLNRFGVTRPAAYFLLGIPLWVAVLKSGVHATLAGVVLAMFIPLHTSEKALLTTAPKSLLRYLEHALHPWVAFGVLPIFAFANAGVPIIGLSVVDALQPVPFGIVTGLFFGKQIGILAMCWLAVRLGIASRPEGVGWWQLSGTALLCGIGFTMSLFIASLAFEQGSAAYLGLERLGILIGSLVSGVLGYVVLRASLSRRAGTPGEIT
jgi:NhaA family Na+:H+ antiporter